MIIPDKTRGTPLKREFFLKKFFAMFQKLGPEQGLHNLLTSRTTGLVQLSTDASEILKNLQDGVIIFDNTGRILMVNPAAPKLMGLTENQMIGKEAVHPMWKTFYEDGRPFHPDDYPVSITLRTGKPVSSQNIVIHHPNGHQVIISTSSSPVFHPDQQKISYVIVSYSDVTEKVLAQRRIEEQNILLINKTKFSTAGEMAAGISHEINNPITVISARASQIRELAEKNNLTPEKVLPLLDRIDLTLERINRITTSMRALFRDGTQDPMIPTNLKQVLQETLDLCASLLKSHQINFTFEIDSDIEILARPSELGQMALNLLSNSKHAIVDLEERWIRVESKIINQFVEIRFYDSGKGIPISIRNKILQPFFTTKAPGQGTGLGLSISKSLAQNHGGDLYLDENEPNTCFVLKLPLLSTKDFHE